MNPEPNQPDRTVRYFGLEPGMVLTPVEITTRDLRTAHRRVASLTERAREIAAALEKAEVEVVAAEKKVLSAIASEVAHERAES